MTRGAPFPADAGGFAHNSAADAEYNINNNNRPQTGGALVPNPFEIYLWGKRE